MLIPLFIVTREQDGLVQGVELFGEGTVAIEYAHERKGFGENCAVWRCLIESPGLANLVHTTYDEP